MRRAGSMEHEIDINSIQQILKHLRCPEQEMEDVAQEAALSIWNSKAGFRGDCAWSTYVYKITARKYIDFLRKKSCRDSVESLYPVYERATGSPESAIIDRLYAEQLIGRLPVPYREIMVTMLDGARLYEIAQGTGERYETVRSRYRRARDYIKENLV